MNKIVPISQDDERLEAASRWVLMLDEDIERVDRKALESWLGEDPKNVAEILEVARVWDKTDELSRLADLFPKERTSVMPRTRHAVIAMAASLLIAVTVGLFWHTSGVDSEPPGPILTVETSQYFERYETAVGEQSNILLPDGSVLVLNTNSHLTVAYSESMRVLQLHRGEIHIEVAEDKSRPLSVLARDRILQAVGTAFSVEITQHDRVELVVSEGKVVVGVMSADVQSRSGVAAGEPEIITPAVLTQSSANTVEAGEELLLGAQEEMAEPTLLEDIEVKLAWREGRLIFRSEPLEKALAEVERYTTIEFVLLDEELKATTVSGRFRAGDVDALLASLALNFNIVHRRDSGGRILLDSR